jgi:hypothetical protein
MRRFLGLLIPLAVLVVAPASARGVYQQFAQQRSGLATATGEINLNGQVVHGTGFTATLVRTGEYKITFDNGFFPSGCAAMTVEGTSFPISGEALQPRCPQSRVVFYVDTYNALNGQLDDLTFQFIAVEENP